MLKGYSFSISEHTTGILEKIERFLCRAQTRRIRDGAVVHAQHLRERHFV